MELMPAFGVDVRFGRRATERAQPCALAMSGPPQLGATDAWQRRGVYELMRFILERPHNLHGRVASARDAPLAARDAVV